MGFRSEIHDRVKSTLREDTFHRRSVGDICMVEDVSCAKRLNEIREICRIPGISQRIHIVDGPARAAGEEQADEIAANKAASAGYEESHGRGL